MTDNFQVDIFELSTEHGRTDLSKWADVILPGTDLVHLQSRAVVGDLVMHRPGHNAFEVFRKVESMNSDRIGARLHILSVLGQTGTVSPEAAKSLDEWVHGA